MTAVAAADSSPTAAEYRAATAGAAVFHSPAGRLRLTGADARDLLNRLSTNSIDPDGAPGAVSATVLTSDRGRIVDLVYVIHCGDHQLLLTGPGQQENVTAFLDKYTIMEDLEVADITDDTELLTPDRPLCRRHCRHRGSRRYGSRHWQCRHWQCRRTGHRAPRKPRTGRGLPDHLSDTGAGRRRRGHRKAAGTGRRRPHQRCCRRNPPHRPPPAGQRHGAGRRLQPPGSRAHWRH